MPADGPDKVYIVQIKEPVGIVVDNGLPVGKVDELAEGLPEFPAVLHNDFLGHHLTHIRSAGGISHHRSAAAHQHDRDMAVSLHMHHDDDLHKMTYMETVRGRVETDIKGDLFLPQQLADLLFMGRLLD
ncbi:hypothetical protein SDC9_155103 [bioreactor metagenome]|uniref:Uncharacterized protein n=1 Tax=bioreactor metagenome TaxID=1076179 RepID=A0A645F0M4_9ZZZZ